MVLGCSACALLYERHDLAGGCDNVVVRTESVCSCVYVRVCMRVLVKVASICIVSKVVCVRTCVTMHMHMLVYVCMCCARMHCLT